MRQTTFMIVVNTQQHTSPGHGHTLWHGVAVFDMTLYRQVVIEPYFDAYLNADKLMGVKV